MTKDIVNMKWDAYRLENQNIPQLAMPGVCHHSENLKRTKPHEYFISLF